MCWRAGRLGFGTAGSQRKLGIGIDRPASFPLLWDFSPPQLLPRVAVGPSGFLGDTSGEPPSVLRPQNPDQPFASGPPGGDLPQENGQSLSTPKRSVSHMRGGLAHPFGGRRVEQGKHDAPKKTCDAARRLNSRQPHRNPPVQSSPAQKGGGPPRRFTTCGFDFGAISSPALS